MAFREAWYLSKTYSNIVDQDSGGGSLADKLLFTTFYEIVPYNGTTQTFLRMEGSLDNGSTWFAFLDTETGVDYLDEELNVNGTTGQVYLQSGTTIVVIGNMTKGRDPRVRIRIKNEESIPRTNLRIPTTTIYGRHFSGMENVQGEVRRKSTGELFDFFITQEDGQWSIRLPVGSYTIEFPDFANDPRNEPVEVSVSLGDVGDPFGERSGSKFGEAFEATLEARFGSIQWAETMISDSFQDENRMTVLPIGTSVGGILLNGTSVVAAFVEDGKLYDGNCLVASYGFIIGQGRVNS
jgi:hypothetical protein